MITNTKVVSHGAQSDHLPVRITIKIKSKHNSNKGRKTKGKKQQEKCKRQKSIIIQSTNTERRQAQIRVRQMTYCNGATEPVVSQFFKQLVSITEYLTETEEKHRDNWFDRSKRIIRPSIQTRNSFDGERKSNT
jgi:hypothetical protein